MKHILITGGAGFIGANFVYYWLANYPEDKVYVLDALTYAGNKATLSEALENPNCTFIHGSIVDETLVENLLRDESIDTIVNFAAESHVDRSISGPDVFIETNIVGTYNLLKCAKKVWMDEARCDDHRFHHVSTDEVYGTLGPNDPAFKETTPYDPRSPYSASKASSDHLVNAYHHTYGMKTTISNCSNNYGPYHFPEKLIPLIITNILHDKALPIYGDGKQIRDWLYVEDHCYGIDLVLKKGDIGDNYNIGGHNEWQNINIVNLVCELMNEAFAADSALASQYPQATKVAQGEAQSLITYVTDRLGHDRRYAIDATKTNNALQYKPRESFETGIRKTVEWYLGNSEWWITLLAK